MFTKVIEPYVGTDLLLQNNLRAVEFNAFEKTNDMIYDLSGKSENRALVTQKKRA